MKRFVLSGIVIVFFIAFSLYYRFMNQSAMPIISTKNNDPTLIPTSVPTATSIPVSTSTSLQPTALPTAVPTAVPPTSSGYKNGSFIGDAADALYGNIQVQIAMQDGKITDVQFLQYPNDRSHSVQINQYAMPILKSEAIQAQSANVDIVSGATDSSQAFIQSLQSALNKAKG